VATGKRLPEGCRILSAANRTGSLHVIRPSGRLMGNHSSVLIAAIASLKCHYSASLHAVADAVAWLP